MTIRFIKSGQSFVLLTQTDGSSGVYADAAARDVYFATANGIIDLARMDANEFIIIKLLDDGAGEIAYQQRAGSVFVDVTSLVQGETGPAGATGNSFFFESITARDDFFNTVGNEQLLMNGLPVQVNEGTVATVYFWSGVDSPSTYDEDLFRPASVGSSPGSLFLGASGTNISSAARNLNLNDAYGSTSIPLLTRFTAAGNTAPFQYDFGVSSLQSVANVFDTLLADPQTMLFNTVSDSMTSGYAIRPGAAGDLRVQAFAGTLETDPTILDVTFAITVGEIGTLKTITLDNKTLVEGGDDVLLKFSGVQLNGGLQTTGGFNGQTVPYLDADFTLLTSRDLVVQGDAITGDLTVDGIIRKGGTTGTQVISGGTDSADGGVMTLLGKDAASSSTFSVNAQDTLPQSTAFNTDGTKMYVAGASSDAVLEYDLSTGFDVSTAVFLQSFDVSAKETSVQSATFNTDGTKMFIVGTVSDNVHEYDLSVAFDISTSVFSVSFNVGAQDPLPRGLNFSSDGTKMYIVGDGGNDINESDLSIAFDISTAVFSVSFSVSAQDTTPTGVAFNADGTKMYISGASSDAIIEYDLSVGFDISTSVFLQSFDVSSQDGDPRGVVFNPDGTKMYMTGSNTKVLYEYDLGTAFDVSSAKFLGVPGGSVQFSSNGVPKGAFDAGLDQWRFDTPIDVNSSGSDTVPIFDLETIGTNGGASKTFLGDQDPNGIITGAGGDEYVRANGAISGSFESREATTGTEWFKRSVNPPTVVEINTLEDLEALATADVITVTGVLVLKFRTAVTTPIRYVNSGTAADLKLIDDAETSTYVYTGTDPFFTAAAGGDIDIQNMEFVAATPGTVLFDYKGILNGLVVDFISISGFSTFINFDLGTIARLPTGIDGPAVVIDNLVWANSTAGLILDTCSDIVITSGTWVQTGAGVGGPVYDIRNSSQRTSDVTINRVTGNLAAGETLVRFDPATQGFGRNIVRANIINTTAGVGLFDTSGTTGTFTAVADNSIGATAITSVTDNGGVAVFNHAGTSPLLGSTVTISGFTTNTDYNQTGIVTLTTATTFEVDFIAFGTDETGSYLVDGVTVTSTSHGLSAATALTLDTTAATDYDGGFLIYNVQTNSFDVAAVFTVTQAGTFSTEGLDQSNPFVLASDNPDSIASHYIATAFVNDNSTANGAIVNNTFTAMVFGTGGSALIEGTTIERWKLIDDVAGIFEYTGNEPFDDAIEFDFTVSSSGGTVDFRFKWEIDTGSGFGDLPDPVEALVAVGSDAQSITKKFPLAAVKGDQIRPRITRNSGTSGITTSYATIYAGE